MNDQARHPAQHGALSVLAGRIVLVWHLDGAAAVLRLHWREAGGLGSWLLEATIQGQLGGTVVLRWRRTGLSCRIELPLARIALADAAGEPIPGEP